MIAELLLPERRGQAQGTQNLLRRPLLETTDERDGEANSALSSLAQKKCK